MLRKIPFATSDDPAKNTSGRMEDLGNLVSQINPAESLSVPQKQTLTKRLDTIIISLICFLVFAVPLFTLPVLTDWFDLPKTVLIVLVSFIGLCLWAAKSLLTKDSSLRTSIFDRPIIILLAVSAVSAFLSTNRTLALFADTALLFGCASFFLLLSASNLTEAQINKVVKMLLLAGALLSAWTIIQTVLTIILPILKIATPWVFLSSTFSPAGGALSQAMFLALTLPLAFFSSSGSEGLEKRIGQIFLFTIIVGLIATISNLYQSNPILLDQASGWRIATGTLGQSLTAALVGIGPAHFVDSFTAYKPVDFNSSPFWNLRFSTSSNYYFYLLTTLGIAGLSAFLWLSLKVIQVSQKRLGGGEDSPSDTLEKCLLAGIALTLVALIFLPGPTIVIFTLFTLLGVLLAHYQAKKDEAFVNDSHLYPQAPVGRIVILALIVLITLAAIFYGGSFVLADYYFASSKLAASQNKGADVYNLQIKALQLNPNNDSYRLAYSQTNLALANAIAAKQNLSDQQKQTVVQLVQQSLREGRIAVALEPRRAADWENLSLIYRNLINFAQGADQWAIASEQQAISFDPANPRLRLDLGGIYLALKDYQSAGQAFAQAVNLKPDFANAHYNLAQALKQLDLKDQAQTQLQLTATLVCSAGKTTSDCDKINAEIADLTAKTPPAAPVATPSAGTSTLATPSAKNNLPKAKTQPPAKISSPSGELNP